MIASEIMLPPHAPEIYLDRATLWNAVENCEKHPKAQLAYSFDIRLVEESKKWVLSPERKAPKKEREYAAARLDGVINKIKNVMQTALAKIQRTLMQPEVKQAGKEQVKKKAKESIMDMLAKAKINADRDNRERWEREGRIAPKKKHDMEL